MANENVKGQAIATTEAPDSLRRKLEQLRKFAVGSTRQTKDVTDDYTLLEGDAGTRLQCTAATAKTLTAPNDLPEGWWCEIIQLGAGQFTVTAASGAAVNSTAANDRTSAQYAFARLDVVSNSDGASASYVMSGDLG